jgi:hypothetical protein
MFGRERPHAGVIITPSEDVRDVQLFRNAIWYLCNESAVEFTR